MTRQSCNLFFNPHIHETGPKGPKHYIFGDEFYLKIYSFTFMLENMISLTIIYMKRVQGDPSTIFLVTSFTRIFIPSFLCQKIMIYIIKHHIHETGPKGPKHCIFGDQFYLKIYSFISMLENMISKFYLKWTEFFSNLCRVPMDP